MPHTIEDITHEIARRFVGTDSITHVDVRDPQNPHIRVTFIRALRPMTRRDIVEMARPHRVRFIDNPMRGNLVLK